MLATLLVFAAGVPFLLVGCPFFAAPMGGLAVGQQAPAITAEGWLNGQPPPELAGKVVVVHAWAWW